MPREGNEELIDSLELEYQLQCQQEAFPSVMWQQLITNYPSQYHDGLIKFLNTTFDSNEYDCRDNERLADLSIQSEVDSYNKRASLGCCGYFDKEITILDKTFKIGFNYGH